MVVGFDRIALGPLLSGSGSLLPFMVFLPREICSKGDSEVPLCVVEFP